MVNLRPIFVGQSTKCVIYAAIFLALSYITYDERFGAAQSRSKGCILEYTPFVQHGQQLNFPIQNTPNTVSGCASLFLLDRNML
jgi:hypothetical protein